MAEIPILLPALDGGTTRVRRSSFVLLKDDGAHCRRGEAIAFCSLFPAPRDRTAGGPAFDQHDVIDLHAVMLAPAAGTVRWSDRAARGGWLDLLVFAHPLDCREEAVLGAIEGASAGDGAESLAPAESVLVVSGRRLSAFADHRGTLLPGWYSHIRSWRLTGQLDVVSIAGTCILRTVVLGRERIAREVHFASKVASHFTYYSDLPFVPAISSLLDEQLWNEERRETIRDELRAWYHGNVAADASRSNVVISLLLDRLSAESPIASPGIVWQLDGLAQLRPPRTVVLTADSEDAAIYRHRLLGFKLALPTFAGPHFGTDFIRILDERFVREPPQPLSTLGFQYRALAKLLRQQGTQLIVVNSVQLRSPSEQPAGLDGGRPELVEQRNGLLRELAEERVLQLVDVAAIVSELGLSQIPDGVHGGGRFETAVRSALRMQLDSGLTASAA